MSKNSFDSKTTLTVDEKPYEFFNINKLGDVAKVDRLPFSIKVVLENLLRHEDSKAITADDIVSLAKYDSSVISNQEIAFSPERVLMQDFTGVPAVADLAAMRDAVNKLGDSPNKINPLVPVELVIDHSVIAESAGSAHAFEINAKIEASRNSERYALLRWAQNSFHNFRVVPPDSGICHQVNLEYLARVVFKSDDHLLYPDTVVGTDSHTTMINGLGVLGWGVGGIEAEAAMLGQPITMLIPPVVGVKLTGKLNPGTTATDLVLSITQLLRNYGVVGKFVEFIGPSLDELALETRATIANMSPEYGATCAYFPIDKVTLDYLRFTGRSEELINIVEAYCKEQGIFRTSITEDPVTTELIEFDLSSVEPSIAGPSRPQDNLLLSEVSTKVTGFIKEKKSVLPESFNPDKKEIKDGSVVIAAITSCTNTSNPRVMIAAGLLAKKASELGLRVPEYVKTSLAPGSMVVTDYLKKAGLDGYLSNLGFDLVGYGCTTCIGNSGPLNEGVSAVVKKNELIVSSVLSGNRNFEGRIHPEVKMNFLASPPLVVAYALAGTMNLDISTDPIGIGNKNQPVYLSDIWPTQEEVEATIAESISSEMFTIRYEKIFDGNAGWKSLPNSESDFFSWDTNSTYVRRPPFFDHVSENSYKVEDILHARALVKVGDSVTTDHISPAGNIATDSPAGKYLQDLGVNKADFNSYGARRGNHEVMVRGTFGNIRLKNQLAPGTEGPYTTCYIDNQVMSIYEASNIYRKNSVPLLVLAGKEYGSGSSRDWAAKGVWMLGVKAVIAESFERIHRSNLVGMGIIPLELNAGDTFESLGIKGDEEFNIVGLGAINEGGIPKYVSLECDQNVYRLKVRIDTPVEADYIKSGGILQYVLKSLAG